MNPLKLFTSNRKGSVSHVFAISVIPLFGFLGIAIDYSRASQAKTTLQAALDSTALMLARESGKKSTAQLQVLGDTYFRALMSKEPAIGLGALNISRKGQLVGLEITGTVETRFAGVFGWPQFEIGGKAESSSGNRRIEVALVLDNTGSMLDQNKIGELKKASHTLLTMLEAAADTPDRVRVSLVPYTTRINLGAAYKNANWLTNTPTGTFIAGYDRPASRTAWTGCVADRDAPYNRTGAPVSVPMPQTLYPMVNCVDTVAPVQPLTANWQQLHKSIDAMKADGYTNIALGASWGLEMLSANVPFAETGTGDDVERFMILLTDGNNTRDRWGTWEEPRMNKDTQAVCDAITERGVPEAAKTRNIKLYTVLVIAGNESLMKNCATQPSMFSKVEQANQLESVFRQIANEIRNVRLTM